MTSFLVTDAASIRRTSAELFRDAKTKLKVLLLYAVEYTHTGHIIKLCMLFAHSRVSLALTDATNSRPGCHGATTQG